MATRKSERLLGFSRRQKQRADMINDLPDSILSHILSFLPTKNAVATGILSKRWKLLWTTTVNLDFSLLKNYAGSIVPFVRFVNYVLILHKPGYLNRFSLTWETGCIPFYVHTWISGAIARDARELFVCVGIYTLPVHVQTCMFTSERLQSLEVKSNICISPQIEVSLPRLEKLKLISVYFQSEKAFCKFLDGCPVLKCLVIGMDIGKMIEHGQINIVDGIALNVDGSEFKCMISSAFLTHLHLYVYECYSGLQGLSRVQLDAPSLRYIMLKGDIHSIFIQQKSLAFLGKANIQVSGFDTEEPSYYNSFVEALGAFGCAKILTLNDQVIWSLCLTDGLTRLEVSIDWNHWSSLQDLIELSDNLQVLIVNKTRGYYTNGTHFNNSNWKNPDLIPRCLSNSLRTVSIGAFDGYPDEFAMVDYIIKHGSVLKIMQICFGESISDLNRRYDLVQEISAFPRKSPICKVKFREYGFERNGLW